MIEFNWKNEIDIWVGKKRKIKPFQTDLIEFFEMAFDNTFFSEKSFFGTSNYSISLLTGGIYFAAYTSNGTIWLLLDKQISDIPNSNCEIVKSTKKFTEPLYWLETEDLNNLRLLICRPDIWLSFNQATEKIFENKMVTSYKENIAKNKLLLSEFWKIKANGQKTINGIELENSLQKELKKAKLLSQLARASRSCLQIQINSFCFLFI